MPYEEHDERETDLDVDDQPNFFDEDPAGYTETYFAERLDIEETEPETFEEDDLDDVMVEEAMDESSTDRFGETVSNEADEADMKDMDEDEPSKE